MGQPNQLLYPMRSLRFFLFAAGLVLCGRIASAQPAPATEAYWTLLHEEAAVADLALTTSQRGEYQAALDALDLRLFPLRNRPAKEAGEGVAKIIADAKSAMAKILTS